MTRHHVEHPLRLIEGFEWAFCFGTDQAPHPGPVYWTQIHAYTITVFREYESKEWTWHFKIEYGRRLIYSSVLDNDYEPSKDPYVIILTAEDRLYKVLAA